MIPACWSAGAAKRDGARRPTASNERSMPPNRSALPADPAGGILADRSPKQGRERAADAPRASAREIGRWDQRVGSPRRW